MSKCVLNRMRIIKRALKENVQIGKQASTAPKTYI